MHNAEEDVHTFSDHIPAPSHSHLDTQVFDPDPRRPDYSGMVMMFVIKLGSFAWAAYDGDRFFFQMSAEQQKYVVKEMPSLLEFFGYVSFFGGWLVGPSINFSDYRSFSRREVGKMLDLWAPFDSIPSSTIPALKAFLIGAIASFIFAKYEKPWTHAFAIEDAFMEKSFFYRLMYINIAGNIQRCKFYGAWKLAEGACILCGIGYAGKTADGRDAWTRVENVNIAQLELAQSPRDYLAGWNTNTGRWLRNCVYLRIAPEGSKRSTALAATSTYLTSAVWHGFRPGYYCTFLSGAQVTIVGQTLRRQLRPLFVGRSRLAPLKPAYDLAGWMLTQAAMNYICAPFPLHSLTNAWRVWGSMFFLVHVFNFAVLGAFAVPGVAAAVRRVGRMLGAEYAARGSDVKIDVKKS
ncbi:MBOAT, membrane-bound O-acyltransferase family-domain-containing protein [Blyttiomyces helicus]|uniref:MBOAT, membrane-bound O-acyltransferase family-domain-containing protein n=1 Tax=Blyttiomyces helicus TaxID=388810 RepID=A0A4P9W608_9FUNG|nr:MBOAT, membrane-bound O-acyltransferase family-domain-containing protein [Blyttiomyces helicus]|eukprot:RKO86775.1 MBOAT, membrane-bound O-acyltransferase family-domain-containing protein [Blyttiomyces helicus]